MAGFFFGVTFIIGGILSYFTNRVVARYNISRVNQIIMIVVGSLCGGGAVSMVANIGISYANFGAEYMVSPPFSCATI